MIRTLQQVLEQTLERLSTQVTTYLPPLLVALIVFGGAFLVAVFCRWLFTRAFKGTRVDRFLHDSGIGSLIDHSGRLRSGRLVASTVFWGILLIGLLNALSVFDSRLTTQIVEGTVLLLPKLLTAGAILLVGVWLAQYLGRGALLWASNEGYPWARPLCALVRVVVVFVSIVVASDVLQFARAVFFSAFLIFTGGAMLAVCLVLAVNGREVVRWLASARHAESSTEHERSLWSHL